MNDGWYGALKETIQQQQNQLVWVSEGKVRDGPVTFCKSIVITTLHEYCLSDRGFSALIRRTAIQRMTWISTMTVCPTCQHQVANTPCIAQTAATLPTMRTLTQRAERTPIRSLMRRWTTKWVCPRSPPSPAPLNLCEKTHLSYRTPLVILDTSIQCSLTQPIVWTPLDSRCPLRNR